MPGAPRRAPARFPWRRGRPGSGRRSLAGGGREPDRNDVGHDHRHDHQRGHGQPVGPQQQGRQQHRGEGQLEHRHRHRADTYGHGRHQREPGQVRRRGSAHRADEHRGKYRTAAEAAQRRAVGEPLAREQHQQRPDGVSSGLADERAERRLPGEQDLGRALPCGGRERDRESGDGQSDQRRENQHAPFHVRPDGQGDPPDDRAEHGGGGRQDERPAELSDDRDGSTPADWVPRARTCRTRSRRQARRRSGRRRRPRAGRGAGRGRASPRPGRRPPSAGRPRAAASRTRWRWRRNFPPPRPPRASGPAALAWRNARPGRPGRPPRR